MVTSFQIPRVLQTHCRGKAELQLRGATVRAVLASLKQEYPSLYICICDETGALRQHLNLFVNDAFLDARQGLDTRLSAGDVVSVFQAVSGG